MVGATVRWLKHQRPCCPDAIYASFTRTWAVVLLQANPTVFVAKPHAQRWRDVAEGYSQREKIVARICRKSQIGGCARSTLRIARSEVDFGCRFPTQKSGSVFRRVGRLF